MKNQVQRGCTITFTADADYKSGDLVIIGDTAGVCVGDVGTGKAGVANTDGVFSVPKEDVAIAQGVKLYRTATGTVTTASSGNKLCGRAWAAAVAGDPVVPIKLTPAN